MAIYTSYCAHPVAAWREMGGGGEKGKGLGNFRALSFG